MRVTVTIIESLAVECELSTEHLRSALRFCLLAYGTDDELGAHHVTRGLIETELLLCQQVDAILHEPAVQKLESLWRQLAYVVEHVDYDGRRVRTEILSCTKDELSGDFFQSPEVSYSGLYQIVYSQGAGLFGGTPYGLVCSMFEFGPGAEDIVLLRSLAAVAAIAHAPFIGNVSPKFLDLDSWGEFGGISDFEALLSGPRFIAWNQFRLSEDARYVGLCLPRFFLRRPYCLESDSRLSFRYSESIGGEAELLWGSASTLFAVVAANSFSKYRWCVFLAGARAGRVARLIKWDLESFVGIWARCPLEFQLTVRNERALAELGFIGFVFERTTFSASMLSTPSLIAAQPLGSRVRSDEELGVRLGAQLNYMLLVCRMAHYIKVIQQERVGQGVGRQHVERDLQMWLRQYVADMDDASVEVMATRPFRRADVRVEDVPGETGWYRCRLELCPHLTHNSASFTLSLVGLLEQSSTVAVEVEANG